MRKTVLVWLLAGLTATGCAAGGAAQKQPDIRTEDSQEFIRDESEQNESGQTEQNEPEQTEQEAAKDSETERIPAEESAQDLYMQFINNEIPAAVSGVYPKKEYKTVNLETGRSYTFTDLGAYVNQNYFDPEYSEKTTYDEVQYTYVDCPDSDSQNFLIKFVGLNFYAPDDESFVVYVLTEHNGQLYLTDEYECWARSYREQYRSGLCSSDGSGGAGDHYAGMSAILSDGRITDIYSVETLYGWWASSVSETIYREVFDENAEILLNVSIYSVGEDRYYMYDLSECTDDQLPLCETFISRCSSEARIAWSTDEEIQEAIKNRCILLGIDYSTLNGQTSVTWTDL